MQKSEHHRLVRQGLRALATLLWLVVGLWLWSLEARAQDAAPGALDATLATQVRQLALDATRIDTGAAQARVEIQVGQLDPRLRLAPCERIEPYLPPGARPWGRTRVGLRCIRGAARWNVYLPVTVKVWGRALVANGALAAGAVLTSADLAQADVDLAEEASAVLVDATVAIGRTLAQPLRAGQGLRQGHLRARVWFAAGDTVRIVAQGAGFSVAGEGQALTPGVEGQTARVRTESGRVLTGQPVGERAVELVL